VLSVGMAQASCLTQHFCMKHAQAAAVTPSCLHTAGSTCKPACASNSMRLRMRVCWPVAVLTIITCIPGDWPLLPVTFTCTAVTFTRTAAVPGQPTLIPSCSSPAGWIVPATLSAGLRCTLTAARPSCRPAALPAALPTALPTALSIAHWCLCPAVRPQAVAAAVTSTVCCWCTPLRRVPDAFLRALPVSVYRPLPVPVPIPAAGATLRAELPPAAALNPRLLPAGPVRRSRCCVAAAGWV
jgi:hypothetical protein